MPVTIGEVSSEVQVETRGAEAGAHAPPPPLPEQAETRRWRLMAHAVARDAARLRAIDRDD